MEIANSTSASSALVDSYNAKQFAVSAIKDTVTENTRIQVISENDVKKIDFSNLSIDCGSF